LNILVAVKVVVDDQDISIHADGSLDYSRAHQIASLYDLNALEAAVQLAATEDGSKVTVISVGGPEIDDSKLRKNLLARGADELLLFVDSSASGLDSYQTARALAALVDKAGEWDLIVCGDGSADCFDQQVDVQLASALGVEVYDAVVQWQRTTSGLELNRELEDRQQLLVSELPLVVSVMPDIALPRICGMKEILAAGKKPVVIFNAVDLDLEFENESNSQIKAPAQQQRAAELFDQAAPGGLDSFCAAARALVGEGVIA
jgi:electron transfer flavoprotein beta subunit